MTIGQLLLRKKNRFQESTTKVQLPNPINTFYSPTNHFHKPIKIMKYLVIQIFLLIATNVFRVICKPEQQQSLIGIFNTYFIQGRGVAHVRDIKITLIC